jgi:MFS family permease
VPRQTGLLTSTYVLAVFLFAPLWGRLSDRLGRRPILLLGLIGLGVSLTLFAPFESLPSLYLARFLNGLFAAAIMPAAYALVGDHAILREWRAHRFTLLNVAGTLGFFVGPLLGGFALRVSRELPLGEGVSSAPFLAASGLTLITALMTWGFVSEEAQRRTTKVVTAAKPYKQAIMLRLSAIAFISTLAIGAFEVGLSLRGKQALGMDAFQIAMLFAECSIVMLVVQALVFSPLVKPDITRWFLTPSLVILALGLALVPLVSGYGATTVAVALVAASAGVLSPIATFWVSLKAGESEGAELGRLTAVQSLGQVLGSAGGGLLFGVSVIPNATFNAAAIIVLTGVAASLRLPPLLVPRHDPGNARIPA